MPNRILLSILAALLISAGACAQQARPALPGSVSEKMAIACERYPSLAMMFSQWTECRTVEERDRKIADLQRGDRELTYSFADMLLRQSGRSLAGAKLREMGLTGSELKLVSDYYDWREADRNRQRTEQQTKDYEEWQRTGVPANAEVSEPAQITLETTEALTTALAKLPAGEKLQLEIYLTVGADGSVMLGRNNTEEARTLFPHLKIEVAKPAEHRFEDIGRSLPMESWVTLIIHVRKELLDYGEDLQMKQDKKTGRWAFGEKERITHRELAEQLLTERLSNAGKKGKATVSYEIHESYYWITDSEDNPLTDRTALPERLEKVIVK